MAKSLNPSVLYLLCLVLTSADRRIYPSRSLNRRSAMVSSLLLGSGLAFAAVLQPGPLQAYFLSSVAQRGWRRTLPAALAPICSDGPIVLTVLFLLTRLPGDAAR